MAVKIDDLFTKSIVDVGVKLLTECTRREMISSRVAYRVYISTYFDYCNMLVARGYQQWRNVKTGEMVDQQFMKDIEIDDNTTYLLIDGPAKRREVDKLKVTITREAELRWVMVNNASVEWMHALENGAIVGHFRSMFYKAIVEKNYPNHQYDMESDDFKYLMRVVKRKVAETLPSIIDNVTQRYPLEVYPWRKSRRIIQANKAWVFCNI